MKIQKGAADRRFGPERDYNKVTATLAEGGYFAFMDMMQINTTRHTRKRRAEAERFHHISITPFSGSDQTAYRYWQRLIYSIIRRRVVSKIVAVSRQQPRGAQVPRTLPAAEEAAFFIPFLPEWS